MVCAHLLHVPWSVRARAATWAGASGVGFSYEACTCLCTQEPSRTWRAPRATWSLPETTRVVLVCVCDTPTDLPRLSRHCFAIVSMFPRWSFIIDASLFRQGFGCRCGGAPQRSIDQLQLIANSCFTAPPQLHSMFLNDALTRYPSHFGRFCKCPGLLAVVHCALATRILYLRRSSHEESFEAPPSACWRYSELENCEAAWQGGKEVCSCAWRGWSR